MSTSNHMTEFSKRLGENLSSLEKDSLENIKYRITQLLNSSSKAMTKSQVNNTIGFVSSIKSISSKEEMIKKLYGYVLSSEGMYVGKTIEKKNWYKGTAIGGMECSNPNR